LKTLFGLSGPEQALSFPLFGALYGALALLCSVVYLLGYPSCFSGALGRSLAVQPALASCALFSTELSSRLAPSVFPTRPIALWVALSIFPSTVSVRSLGSLGLVAVAAADAAYRYGAVSELLCKRL
jgi:hypothetical protein